MDIEKILSEHALWLAGNGGKRADLWDANLQGADLQRADLRRAELQDADLRDADLRGANLWDADLRRAELQDANLQGADLQRADLRGANLRRADLRDVNLDFSCWPLWCGSLGVKVDARLVNQLLYHICSLDCADADFQAVRPVLLRLANKFHRIEAGECPKLI